MRQASVGVAALLAVLVLTPVAQSEEISTSKTLVFTPVASALAASDAESRKSPNRLERVIEEKNKALDLAISEIRKLRSMKQVFVENSFLEGVYHTSGWEKVEIREVGPVSIKPVDNKLYAIKAEVSQRDVLAKALSTRMVAMINCGDGICFVVPLSAFGKDAAEALQGTGG